MNSSSQNLAITRIVRIASAPSVLLWICVAGLVVRILAALLLSGHPLSGDAADYNEMALRLLSREAFIPYWPPGVPLYLMILHALFGASALALRLGMLPFYVLTTVFLSRATLALSKNVLAANVAATMLAVSPAAIHVSIEPLTQMPTAACLAAVAWVMLDRRAQGAWLPIV